MNGHRVLPPCTGKIPTVRIEKHYSWLLFGTRMASEMRPPIRRTACKRLVHLPVQRNCQQLFVGDCPASPTRTSGVEDDRTHCQYLSRAAGSNPNHYAFEGLHIQEKKSAEIKFVQPYSRAAVGSLYPKPHVPYNILRTFMNFL
jgi:hypothetical protein